MKKLLLQAVSYHSINNKLDEYDAELTKLIDIEKDLSIALSKEETFKELDKLVKKLNENIKKKVPLRVN
nr:hypothetical protein [Mycoplasmopsis bovis]